MKTGLEHLPPMRRRELERVVEILFAEFQDAIVLGTQAHKRLGRILKIILYGSRARGEGVDDPIGGYVSDIDLLVVVNHERLTDMVEYWSKAEDCLMREQTITHRLSAPVSLIVHSLADVNGQLQRGRPFFMDIVRDGIALYEATGHECVRPEPLAPAEALKEARQLGTRNISDIGKQRVSPFEDLPGESLEKQAVSAYLPSRRVMLWLTSKTSHPGDLNSSLRELFLPLTVVWGTRRPPGLTRSEWIETSFTVLAAPPPYSAMPVRLALVG